MSQDGAMRVKKIRKKKLPDLPLKKKDYSREGSIGHQRYNSFYGEVKHRGLILNLFFTNYCQIMKKYINHSGTVYTTKRI